MIGACCHISSRRTEGSRDRPWIPGTDWPGCNTLSARFRDWRWAQGRDLWIRMPPEILSEIVSRYERENLTSGHQLQAGPTCTRMASSLANNQIAGRKKEMASWRPPGQPRQAVQRQITSCLLCKASFRMLGHRRCIWVPTSHAILQRPLLHLAQNGPSLTGMISD